LIEYNNKFAWFDASHCNLAHQPAANTLEASLSQALCEAAGMLTR